MNRDFSFYIVLKAELLEKLNRGEFVPADWERFISHARANGMYAMARDMERRLAQASDPKETFAVEAASKAAMAWAKEQQDYEMLINAGRLYLLSKRKTTELIEPEIGRGGDRGINQYGKWQSALGGTLATLADYGFTKKQWQIRKKLLEISEDQIDDYIDYCIEVLGEPTTGGLIRYLVDQEREALNALQEPDDIDYTDELINKWGVEYGQKLLFKIGTLTNILQYDILYWGPNISCCDWRPCLRADQNQKEIVDCLRGMGASVVVLSQVGRGCPDLLVAKNGVTFLLEVKTPKGRLSETQKEFFDTWNGRVYLVRSAEEATELIDAVA